MAVRIHPFTTADGRAGLARPAMSRDARAAIAIVRATAAERPRTILTTEHDLWSTHEWRRRRLEWSPRGVTLVAEVDATVAGLLGCVRKDARATRHVAEFGISVAAPFRGIGVGTALLATLERWAAESAVARIELGVFAENERARRLYERCGYEVEGVERRAARYPEGDRDIVRMAKLLA